MGLLLVLVAPFGLAIIMGAPWLPTLPRYHEPLLDLTGLRTGQTLIELGSGDGRLLRAAAKRGIRGIGYEINPFLWVVSQLVLWRHRDLATVRLANFWTVDLRDADAVYVFLVERSMTRLNAKLQDEIREPTAVVSFVFQLPGQAPERSLPFAHRYTYGFAVGIPRREIRPAKAP
ncbi:class I SAM-dependent methyltransferase [Dactylosporangium sp. NPDC000521]|uniref:class I SAM-dependent methyltransferase n=1 Tax=Dactylosporangium sp. NPDC000521 TaxID=3363975 RepID=UPI0036A13116